jgi:hypothetical protein
VTQENPLPLGPDAVPRERANSVGSERYVLFADLREKMPLCPSFLNSVVTCGQLKCDNVIPHCTNCGIYGKECIYVELPKKARPSSAKIARLEEENQRLRAQWQLGLHELPPQDANPESQSRSKPPSVNHSVVGANESSISAVEIQEESVGVNQQQQETYSAPPSRQLVPPSDSVSYYGRTSALFEDGGPHQDSRSTNISNAGQVSERTQLILMGEATRQSNVSPRLSSGILLTDTS